MILNYASPTVFETSIDNKKIKNELEQITNDYDLLCYVKNHISFFMESQLVTAEWFSKFDTDILNELHIYTTKFSGVEVRKDDVSILVIDCNFDLKTYNDVSVNIRFYGKSYGSIFLNAATSANIKVTGTSTVELYASDNVQANVLALGKSRLFVEAHKNSFLAIRNRSRGEVQIDKGEENVICQLN